MLDRNGHEIKSGDVVLVPCTVKSFSGATATLETFEKAPSTDQKTTLILEPRQFQLAEPPAPAAPEPAAQTAGAGA